MPSRPSVLVNGVACLLDSEKVGAWLALWTDRTLWMLLEDELVGGMVGKRLGGVQVSKSWVQAMLCKMKERAILAPNGYME